MRRRQDVQQVGIEIAWCPGCRVDTTMETVVLPGDPGPVGVCCECGDGIEPCGAPAPAGADEYQPPRAS